MFFPPQPQNMIMNGHFFKTPITINDFILEVELGSGCFGSVYKARYKHNGNVYAVKFLKQSSFNTTQKQIDFLRERAILYDLARRNYPHVVRLYIDFEDIDYRYFVMELLEGTYLHKLKGTMENKGYVDKNLIINILTQLLETLKFLHDTCHIIHRDIKPDNIILEKNNNIKLLDFGLSVYLENQNKQLVSSRSLKGALKFVPDEIILRPFPLNYDYKIDVFALGFTIFSIMNPTGDKNYILPKITEGKYGNIRRYKNYIINNFYESWIFEFISLLYEDNQMKRPTAATALGFLNKLLTDPNMMNLYNNLKNERKKENDNINNLFRRGTVPSQNLDNQINQNNNNPDKGVFAQNSQINNKKSEVEEFLRPNMGKENRIKSSMKCLIYILYKLDIINNIKTQIFNYLNNPQLNCSQLVLYSFFQMLNTIQQLEFGQINIANYDQTINDFITKIFDNNNTGISGARPIILFYMMSSCFKDEFKQYFNNICQNNIYDYIINNNFSIFNVILPMNNQDVYKKINEKIFSFKNLYKGPFVDNFYFLLLTLSKCPQCGGLFGISEFVIATFLQLDVPNEMNNITDLINNFFTPKPGTGNYNCIKCGCQGKKLRHKYCLNLPNYLFLELEDKNKINFTDKIAVPLFNGQFYYYQFYACIYKYKMNDILNFGSVLKVGDAYWNYSDDRVMPYSSNIILDCPCLALYKRITF